MVLARALTNHTGIKLSAWAFLDAPRRPCCSCMLFYLVAHSLFSPPRTSRHPFQSLNQSDSPLRVKNHWHWDESDLTRHYADSRAQRDLSWGPRLGWGSGCPGLCARPFSSTSGPRKTEESNSIPAPVLTAPPSAQRSWTDQPGCGEHCYLNSFLSLYAVLHGTTLKVSTVIFLNFFFSVHTGC